MRCSSDEERRDTRVPPMKSHAGVEKKNSRAESPRACSRPGFELEGRAVYSNTAGTEL